jgi:hypothetical protein
VSRVKRALWFAVTVALVLGLSAWAASAALYGRIGQDGVQAIVMSAGIAFVVQCLTFGVALVLIPSGLMLGWGAGILFRVFTVVVHGLVGVRLLGIRADAALISLAGFFFLTSLIELFFLPRPATTGPTTKPTARAS